MYVFWFGPLLGAVLAAVVVTCWWHKAPDGDEQFWHPDKTEGSIPTSHRAGPDHHKKNDDTKVPPVASVSLNLPTFTSIHSIDRHSPPSASIHLHSPPFTSPLLDIGLSPGGSPRETRQAFSPRRARHDGFVGQMRRNSLERTVNPNPKPLERAVNPNPNAL